MPLFETEIVLACPPDRVFDFLCRPANLILVSPPELHMRLVEGPERLQLGSRITVQGRRHGVPQRIVSEVTVFEENALLVDDQREGPFRKWSHAHRLEIHVNGTRMFDRIDYEAPGGLLGLVLTNRRIEQELQTVFAFRSGKFKDLLENQGLPSR